MGGGDGDGDDRGVDGGHNVSAGGSGVGCGPGMRRKSHIQYIQPNINIQY